MYIEDMTAEEINRMPKLKYRERMDNELAYQWLFRCFVNEKDYPKTYQIIQNALDHDNDTLYYLNPFEVARRLYWADENQYCPKEIFIFMEKAFRDQLYLLSDPLAADFLGDLFYLPRFRHMNEKKSHQVLHRCGERRTIKCDGAFRYPILSTTSLKKGLSIFVKGEYVR